VQQVDDRLRTLYGVLGQALAELERSAGNVGNCADELQLQRNRTGDADGGDATTLWRVDVPASKLTGSEFNNGRRDASLECT
jgi:hypothetical protein